MGSEADFSHAAQIGLKEVPVIPEIAQKLSGVGYVSPKTIRLLPYIMLVHPGNKPSKDPDGACDKDTTQTQNITTICYPLPLFKQSFKLPLEDFAIGIAQQGLVHNAHMGGDFEAGE